MEARAARREAYCHHLTLLTTRASCALHAGTRHRGRSLDTFLGHSGVSQALLARQALLRSHTLMLLLAAFGTFLTQACCTGPFSNLVDPAVLICRVLDPDASHLIVELSALRQVPMLVIVRLVLEVLSIGFRHGLPRAPYLLHHFQSAHIRIARHNFRSRFLDENHVSGEAFFGLLDRLALAFELLELALVSLLV